MMEKDLVKDNAWKPDKESHTYSLSYPRRLRAENCSNLLGKQPGRWMERGKDEGRKGQIW